MKVPKPDPSVVWLPVMIGLAVVPQQVPFAVTVAPPSVVTLPPAVAVFMVMAVAAAVVTMAWPGVKVKSAPLVVPSLFTATILKW